MKHHAIARTSACTAIGVMAIVLATSLGCGLPPRMRLSFQSPMEPGRTVWWSASDDHDSRPPIVAIEHGYPNGRTDQIIFAEGGVRVFQYQRGRLRWWSPPLSAEAGATDIAMVRSAVRHFAGNPFAESASTLPPLPADAVAAIDSSEDISRLLREHWSGVRVKPPPNMTYTRIANELEQFRHGTWQLMQASSAMGG